MTTIGKRIELELPCALTEHEMQSRSMMLVETVAEKDDTSAAKRETMKGFNERLTALDVRQRQLAVVLRTGIERRMVVCTVLYHTPAEATKRIVRMDTGEVVKEQAMTPAECQMHMFAAMQDFENFMQQNAGAEPGEDGGNEDEPPDVAPDQPRPRPGRPRPQ